MLDNKTMFACVRGGFIPYSGSQEQKPVRKVGMGGAHVCDVLHLATERKGG